MMLASRPTVAARAPAGRRSVATRAIKLPTLPFLKQEEEIVEETSSPFKFELPSLSFGGSAEPSAPIKNTKSKTVKQVKTRAPTASSRVSRPRAKTVKQVAPKPKKEQPRGNPFSTVELYRPVGSIGREEGEPEIDLNTPKPSPWERWGRGN